jgi:hypothetical protein
VVGNVIALRAPVRRPILVAACALVIGSTQALIIGSGLRDVRDRGAGDRRRRGGRALLHLLGHVAAGAGAPGAVARVSSYDFTVSLGLMPLGLALAGPVSDALGLEETLRLMSAVSILVALGWLAAPSVRQLRRPSAAPPPPAPEAAVQVEAPLSAPSGGSGRAR